MSPGLIVALILVVGVGLVVAATIADRRAERKLQPGTERPAAATGNSAATDPPAYVTSQQLLDNAGPAAAFSPDEERTLASQLEAASTVRIEARLAAPTLATHTGMRAILDRPRVLVCSDTIGQLREVMALLATASADKVPLLIAAPNIDADVLSTLAANRLAGTLEVTVVLGEPDAIAQLASALGQEPTTLADRQAGIRLADLPHPSRIVASEQATWLIEP